VTASEREAPSPLDQAMALFVYAPIGLLFDGAELLPQLVERGRIQVTTARVVGRYAVARGRSEVTKAADRLQDQAAGVLDLVGGSLLPSSPDDPTTPPSPPPAPQAPVPVPAPMPPSPVPAVDATDLAIPDYDGLSASHVVNRLAGLAPDELEAVRAYEAAGRGRKTILSKVAQLQGA
jgi:hypothetical protein